MANRNKANEDPTPEDVAKQEQSEIQNQDQPNETAESVASTIAESDQRGGDVFGATESPSPALQSDLVSQEVSENGTVTDIPSGRLDKETLKRLNGE